MKKLAADEAKLQARKNAARQEALDTVNELVAVFQFKASDLKFGAKPAATAAVAKAKTTRKKVAAKYRTASGETWTGRGKQPKFIRDALAKGVTLESMLIKR